MERSSFLEARISRLNDYTLSAVISRHVSNFEEAISFKLLSSPVTTKHALNGRSKSIYELSNVRLHIGDRLTLKTYEFSPI